MWRGEWHHCKGRGKERKVIQRILDYPFLVGKENTDNGLHVIEKPGSGWSYFFNSFSLFSQFLLSVLPHVISSSQSLLLSSTMWCLGFYPFCYSLFFLSSYFSVFPPLNAVSLLLYSECTCRKLLYKEFLYNENKKLLPVKNWRA